jgi:hypothetical protein
MFKSCDKDGSGQLSERELQTALVNGDWTAFDPHTVRMMIRLVKADSRDGASGRLITIALGCLMLTGMAQSTLKNSGIPRPIVSSGQSENC